MRLDELVAAFQGEIEIDVHRVTPINGSGKSQFRGIVNYANGSGVVHQGVLDLLVNGAEADVSFDTIYVDTVPIPTDLGKNDAFPITYISDHEPESNGRIPIRILSIGATTVGSSEEKAKVETPKEKEKLVSEKKKKPTKQPPLESTGQINYTTITRTVNGIEIYVMKDVAEVGREFLIQKGLSDNQTRGTLYDSVRFRGFVNYEDTTNGKRTYVLVPRNDVEVFRKDLIIEEGRFRNIEFLAEESVSKYVDQYVTGENENLRGKIDKSKRMVKEGKTYFLKESIDAILKEAGIDIEDKRGAPANVGTEYIGAILSISIILERCEINNPALGTELKRVVPHVIGRSASGSRKLYFFIQEGDEETVHKRFSLEEGDVKIYTQIDRAAYDALCKTDETQRRNFPFYRPDGTEFFVPEFVSFVPEKTETKKKEIPGLIHLSNIPMFHGKGTFIDMSLYKPLGAREGKTYAYEDRSVQLFEEPLVPYSEVVNRFAPTDPGMEKYFNVTVRKILDHTSAATERRKANGSLVPKKELGLPGKKYFLDKETANRALELLIDVGYTCTTK